MRAKFKAATALNIRAIAFETRTEMDKRSDDSKAMLEYWDLTDTIVDGITALRKAGKKYFPEFPGEDKNAYDFRLSTSTMTNIYRDIVESLASKPFEEEITLSDDVVNETIETFIENVDGSGNNISVFSSNVFFNAINSAVHWIFVDFPRMEPGAVRTVADAKALGVRPFWSHVLGRNVLECRWEIIAGAETLTYIRILEPGKPNRVRVFERLPDGVVQWSLWQPIKDVSKFEWEMVDSGTISIGVIPFVPFATGRRIGRLYKYLPVMRDAVDLQAQLFKQESALEYASIMAGYPMLAGNGVEPRRAADGRTIEALKIGPGVVLYAPPTAQGTASRWEFIEPSASSLEFLGKQIEKRKLDLRELGRQPLTAQSGNLTVITTAFAAGKAKSAVQAWAYQLKDALENALKITCMWLNINDYEPEISVFTDFDNFVDGGADIVELGAARTRRDLSQETYWSELKRRRYLSSDFDAEQERERLLAETPADEFAVEEPLPQLPGLI